MRSASFGILALTLGLSLFGVPDLWAQAPSLTLTDSSGTIGGTATSSVLLDSPFDVRGWSFGICSDPTELRVTDVELGVDLLAATGGSAPSFFNVTLYPTGATVGVVIDVLGQVTIPAGSGRHVHDVVTAVTAPMETTSELCVCGTLGSPPVAVVLTDPFSQSVTPSYGCADVALTPPVIPSVAQINPSVHPTTGGTVISIVGDDLSGVDQLAIGATLIPVQQQIGGRLIRATLPAIPAGVYFLALLDADGSPLAILPDAIDIQEPRLPPIGEVRWQPAGDDLELHWHSWTALASVEIERDGIPIATIPGDVSRYVDDGHSGSAHYRLVGFDSEGRSTADAVLFASTESCDPARFMPVPGELRLPLTGDPDSVRPSFFELTTPVPDGVRIVTLADRRTLAGSLRATIFPADDPAAPVVVDAAFSVAAVSFGASPVELIVGQPLAAGAYVIEYSVGGGAPSTEHFELISSAITEDAGAPFPCPPYAYTHVEPLCGDIPPVVTDIDSVAAYVPDSAALAAAPLSTSGLVALASGSGSLHTLRTVASDPDGEIVRYHWDFGDGFVTTTVTDTVPHVFETHGFYEVQVIVEDDDGLTGVSTKTLSITPYVPQIAGAVQVSVLDHDPNDTIVPDLDSIDVYRTYTAQVTPSPGAGVDASTVVMQIIDPTTGVPTQTLAPAAPTLDPTIYRGTFNVSDFPNRPYVTLRVTASDTAGHAGQTEVDIPLCTRPELGPSVSWTHDTPSGEYRVVGEIDAATLYEETFSLGAYSPSLSTTLPFRVEFQLRLRDQQWYADSLRAFLTVSLFGSTAVTQEITISSSDLTLLGCPSFGVRYVREDIRLFDWSWSRTIIPHRHLAGTAIFILGIPAIYVDLYGRVHVAASFEVDLDLDVTLQNVEPHFDLEACFRPSASFAAYGSVETRVAVLLRRWRIFTAMGTLIPSVSLDLPVQLDLEFAPADFDLRAQDYWDIGLDYEIHGKILWHPFTTGVQPIGHWTFQLFGGDPPTCWVPGVAGAAGPPPADLLVPRLPTIDTSPDGSRGLLVSVEEVPEGADLWRSTLRFAVRTGDTWNPSQPLFSADGVEDTEPVVVCSSNDHAWVAWRRTAWTQSQVESATLDVASINDYYGASEIYCARYTFGSGWSSPIRVTDDDRYQGEPALAAIDDDQVCVAWVSRDSTALLAGDGSLTDSTHTVECAFVTPTSVGPIVDLSTGPGLPPVESVEPSIDFDGSTGRVVWIRRDDLQDAIVSSVYDGTSWSAPALLLDSTEQTLESPSLALGVGSAEGAVAYTYRDGRAGDPGVGFDQHLAVLDLGGGGVIDHILPRDRCPTDSLAAASILVQNPTLHPQVEPGRYVVAARTVVAAGPDDVDPEVGLFHVDLTTPGGAISSPQLLTNDAVDQMEPAVAVRPSGRVDAAWNQLDGDFAFAGLLVEAHDLTPDLAVGEVLVSNALPQPGERVVVQVDIINRGLAATSAVGNSVRVLLTDPAGPIELASTPLSAALEPGHTTTLELEFVALDSVLPLEIRIEPGADDFDPTNDAVPLTLGVKPPTTVACEDLEGSTPRRTLVTWESPQLYDSVTVLRNGAALVELVGTATSYIDVDAPAGSHTYAVRGSLRGRSSYSTASCASDTPFRRGDVNADGSVDLSDAVTILGALFTGTVLSDCEDVVDTNDDGQINIGDAVSLLGLLFVGGGPLPPPFPGCGPDPTPDELDCAEWFGCALP